MACRSRRFKMPSPRCEQQGRCRGLHGGRSSRRGSFRGLRTEIDPRLQGVTFVDSKIVAGIVPSCMHSHPVWSFHGEGCFLRVIEEVDGSDHRQAGNNGPPLFQIHPVHPHAATVDVFPKFDRRATLLNGLQWLGAFISFAEDEPMQKTARRIQQQGSQEYPSEGLGPLMQPLQRLNRQERERKANIELSKSAAKRNLPMQR